MDGEKDVTDASETRDAADLRVRQAWREDARHIARLSLRACNRHIRRDCSADGFRRLLSTMVTRAVEQRLDDGNYGYRVAVCGENVVGVCAMRGVTHLYHLFVADEWQGRGVGRRLWEAVLHDDGNRTRVFTVNASTHARGFYARLGFVAAGRAIQREGIRSWPMQASR